MTERIATLVANHRFFAHMKPEHLHALALCATERAYGPQEMLGQEGAPSDAFFAILDGKVAIETYQPGKPRVVLQTLHGGDIVGWSWLFPPYEWVFDARAVTQVHVLAFDASRLRDACEKDKAMGFALMKRFAHVMTLRLKATRLQLLDMYGRVGTIPPEEGMIRE